MPRNPRRPRRVARRHVPRRSVRSETQRVPATMAAGSVTTFHTPGKTFTSVRSSAPSSVGKAAGDQGYSFNFQLNSLVSAGELTSLFDQYRVDWFDVVFMWDALPGYAQLPTFYVAQDWDGINGVPGSSGYLSERASTKTVMFDATHRVQAFRVVRPGVLMANLSAAPGVLKRSPWLDIADTAEPHFGLLVWGTNYNTTLASGTMSYYFRAQITCRSTR